MFIGRLYNINTYKKEQIEDIPGQINDIWNSVEDRQSCIAQQTVKEVSKSKSTSSAKLKAANQEEWIHMWKEHFKNLLGKSPKVIDKPITKMINHHLDIKLGLFTQEELNVILRKIKNKKVIYPEHDREIDKRLNPPFPQERRPQNC